MKTKDPAVISTAPGMVRFNSFEVEGFAETEPRVVDREKAVIEGLAVISIGEAKGHGMFIDGQFLNDLVTFSEMPEGAKGFRARWTHPGLSSDGMGKQLGRVSGFRRDGDVVRGDITFLNAARNAPGLGDLPDYLMSLAEEDPSQFGASIVFLRDMKAEDQFVKENLREGKFVSPDPRNKNNFPHVRLSELRFVDMVESPAANSNGLFAEGSELPAAVESALDYGFGFAEHAPSIGILGIHPERIKEFVQRYAASRGIGKQVGIDLTTKKESEGDIMELNEGFTMDQLFQARPDLKEKVDGMVTQAVSEESKRFGEHLAKIEEICLSSADNIDVVFSAAKECIANGESARSLELSIKAKLFDRQKSANEEANKGVAASKGEEPKEEGYADAEDELHKRAEAYAVAKQVSYAEAVSQVAKIMDHERRGNIRKGGE